MAFRYRVGKQLVADVGKRSIVVHRDLSVGKEVLKTFCQLLGLHLDVVFDVLLANSPCLLLLNQESSLLLEQVVFAGLLDLSLNARRGDTSPLSVCPDRCIALGLDVAGVGDSIAGVELFDHCVVYWTSCCPINPRLTCLTLLTFSQPQSSAADMARTDSNHTAASLFNCRDKVRGTVVSTICRDN